MREKTRLAERACPQDTRRSAINFISAHLAPKSAIYGEGFCQKCWPEGQFPEKHLQELLRPIDLDCYATILTLYRFFVYIEGTTIFILLG
jgi:hypothetical protein